MKVKSLSRVQLFATPWTVAYQAPPSMGFSRQEYWSGVPLASPVFISNTLIFEGKFEFMEAPLLCSSVRLVSELQFSSLLNRNKNNGHFIEHYAD